MKNIIVALFAAVWLAIFICAGSSTITEQKTIEAGTVKVEFVTERIVQPVNVSGIYTDAGEYELTAYCPCEICCEEWALSRPNGIVYTASGEVAQEGVTVAADTSVFPFGTKLLIDGQVYIVQDRGGAVKGRKLDIYYGTHEAALQFSKRTATVYRIIEEGGRIDER